MTFNGSWGYMPYAPDSEWRSPREVLHMLRTAAGGQGNLLLNIGPAPDGSVPPQAAERLEPVGRWLEKNGEAVYGQVERAEGKMEWMPLGAWTIKHHTAYFWCTRWPAGELAIGGLKGKVLRASFLATGQPVAFEQNGDRLVFKGLPVNDPDPELGITVLKLECDAPPRQELGAGCIIL
jgi:alpha-L-fucosidase